jgi:predicted transcriptional regulator
MIAAMTEGDEIRARIEQAAQARRERQGLLARLESVADHVAQLDQRVADLRSRLADEEEDVDKLESFSFTRVWATLKGSRDGDVERERAERDAARYAVAEAEARRDLARRDAESLHEQLRQLGDVEAVYAQALEAKQVWVQAHDPATAEELAGIAKQRGELAAEDREAREAHAAGRAALDLLAHARQLLGSAGSWSTWDTFGGGGLITDMIKYDKLDRVTDVLRQADIALGRFSHELADLGVAGVAGVQVDGLTRTFDVLFDNLFSDLAVRSRIREAAGRVERAMEAVDQVLRRLASRGAEIGREVDALEEQRQRLLVGG